MKAEKDGEERKRATDWLINSPRSEAMAGGEEEGVARGDDNIGGGGGIVVDRTHGGGCVVGKGKERVGDGDDCGGGCVVDKKEGGLLTKGKEVGMRRETGRLCDKDVLVLKISTAGEEFTSCDVGTSLLAQLGNDNGNEGEPVDTSCLSTCQEVADAAVDVNALEHHARRASSSVAECVV